MALSRARAARSSSATRAAESVGPVASPGRVAEVRDCTNPAAIADHLVFAAAGVVDAIHRGNCVSKSSFQQSRFSACPLFSMELLMGTQTWRMRTCSVVASLLALGSVTGALAADSVAAPVPTKEMREKMAVLHEQMAACLRSEKAISECRAALMQGCRTDLGAQGCPMMGLGRSMGLGPRIKPNAPPGSATGQ